MEAPVITFPAYLNDDAYKNRHLSINVKLAPEMSGDYKEVIKKVLSDGKEMADTISKNSKSNTGLEENHKSIKKYRNKMRTGVTILKLVLPLPNELNDSQSHTWNKESGVISTLSKKITDLSLGGVSVSTAVGSLADSFGIRKPMADPGYFQNYEGSEPRTFTLSFDLIPESAIEMKNMMDIIKYLKQYSLPAGTMDGVSIVAPHFFDISISNKYIDDLTDIKGVVLTNMTIDWGADGAMQYLPDGSPKHTKLTLSFTERRMRTSAMYYQ